MECGGPKVTPTLVLYPAPIAYPYPETSDSNIRDLTFPVSPALRDWLRLVGFLEPEGVIDV